MLIKTYTFLPTTIVRIIRESPRAVSVEVERPKGYDFSTGQHAIVRVMTPSGTRLVRQYSFSAAPNAENLWFTIIQQKEGEVSAWFNSVAKIGDHIEITPPYEGPLVQKTPRGSLCMIAGGSGIAPLMSHLRTLRSSGEPYTATLLYSTRHAERCYENELHPLGAHETLITRLTNGAPRFSLDEIVQELTPDTQIYLCGSRSFVVTMRTICETVVDSTQIHSEAFTL